MIQFPCTCGHVFSLPDDEAGGLIQCPACSRLNDVPSHSDLQNLAEDGTFKLNEPPPKPADDPDRVGELAYVFRKSRLDEEGEEIDLRNTADDLRTLDPQPFALEPGQVKRHAPQYDPETGELIRPLELMPDPVRDVDPAAIPMATQVGQTGVPVIGYARRRPPDLVKADKVTIDRVPLVLFRPANLVVMGCIFIGHVFLNIVVLTVLSGIVFIFIGALVLMALLVAHYGNVIDEIAREDADELPRPLRQLNWLDDLWNPFQQVFGSFMLCFLPAFIALLFAAHLPQVLFLAGCLPALILAIGGVCFYPAVVLTLATSGSLLNLRPDRVLGVIRASLSTYPLTALIFGACLLTYGAGVLGTLYNLLIGIGFTISWDLSLVGRFWVSYPLLIVGIYLAHWFCWRLGLTYRANQPQFPWVLQRFYASKDESSKLTAADRDEMRRRREMREETRRQIHGQPRM